MLPYLPTMKAGKKWAEPFKWYLLDCLNVRAVDCFTNTEAEATAGVIETETEIVAQFNQMM